jgi:hypothetical protein
MSGSSSNTPPQVQEYFDQQYKKTFDSAYGKLSFDQANVEEFLSTGGSGLSEAEKKAFRTGQIFQIKKGPRAGGYTVGGKTEADTVVGALTSGGGGNPPATDISGAMALYTNFMNQKTVSANKYLDYQKLARASQGRDETILTGAARTEYGTVLGRA